MFSTNLRKCSATQKKGATLKAINKFLDKIVGKIDSHVGAQPDKAKIVITLEDLSVIWTKYNNSYLSDGYNGNDDPLTTIIPEAPEDSKSTVFKEAEPTVSPEKENSKPKAYELSTETNAFYTEIIEPNIKSIESYGILKEIKDIITILDKYGNCPSIVDMKEGSDDEGRSLSRVAHALKKVTVRDHSYRVVKLSLYLLRNEYALTETFVPQMIVAALAHDIGKIPEIRGNGQYRKMDHPVISAEKITEIFNKDDYSTWLKAVVQAVKEHHHGGDGHITLILMDADKRAREEEITANDNRYKTNPWEEWFDVAEFIKIIEPHVNVVQTGKMWNSFSYTDGYVYTRTDFLFESVNEYAESKNILDTALMSEYNKESVIKKVVKSFLNADVTDRTMKEGSVGKYFEIKTFWNEKRKLMLVPIHLNAFSDPGEIERIKESYPPIIQELKLLDSRR